MAVESESSTSPTQIDFIESSAGLYDDPRYAVKVDGEAFNRVELRTDGVFQGDGTQAPAAVGSGGGGGGGGGGGLNTPSNIYLMNDAPETVPSDINSPTQISMNTLLGSAGADLTWDPDFPVVVQVLSAGSYAITLYYYPGVADVGTGSRRFSVDGLPHSFGGPITPHGTLLPYTYQYVAWIDSGTPVGMSFAQDSGVDFTGGVAVMYIERLS